MSFMKKVTFKHPETGATITKEMEHVVMDKLKGPLLEGYFVEGVETVQKEEVVANA